MCRGVEFYTHTYALKLLISYVIMLIKLSNGASIMKDGYKKMQKATDKSFKGMDNSHYSQPSMYGKMVREQYNKQPKMCGQK